MELSAFLDALDRAAANLAKLEAVWERAAPYMPTGPSAGSPPEYDDLRRAWADLLAGLPPIDGWTITEPLPDVDAIGQEFIGYFEIGEHAFPLYEATERPARDVAEYRYRLSRARRRAARQRLEQLVVLVDTGLPLLLTEVPRDSTTVLSGELVEQLNGAFSEIERLMADSPRTAVRWTDLHRHLWFGQGHDWHDVMAFDWPNVRSDVENAGGADADPLPVPDMDLGIAALDEFTGAATSALPWERLDDEGFERLLYDLLQVLPQHQNVQWLQRTKAPDRGRDLSCERVTSDGAGGTRTERVIVQAKHWRAKSIAMADVAANVAYMNLVPPPKVRVLIFAASGAFTSDAIEWVERHNNEAVAPHIELWPHSRLETLLAARPGLAATHGLR